MYVTFPSHVGEAETTGALGVKVLPHASVTVGTVGATTSDGQATVEEALAGIVKSALSIINVCVQVCVFKTVFSPKSLISLLFGSAYSVTVKVLVTFPSQTESAVFNAVISTTPQG